MQHLWKTYGFGIVFGLLLTAFTAYALLDVFVIPHRYESVNASSSYEDDTQSASGKPSGSSGGDQQLPDSTQPEASDSQSADGAATSDDEQPESGALTGDNGSSANGESAGNNTPSDNRDGRNDASSPATSSVENSGSSGSAAEIISTDTEYSDGNISISITTCRKYDTDIYVADIRLSSAQYLKAALADNTYGRNVKDATSAIAKENDAILAINGDFYGAQSEGYVIRNGVLYRSSAVRGKEDLVIYADGSMEIIVESDRSAEELLEAGAQQVLSFGPALIEDGEVVVSNSDEVGKAMSSNPRTAIGILDDLHYVFVVSDGRTRASEGLSLHELAQFMESLGVETAYNLDGGGSSTMYFNGQVINNPTTNGRTIRERSVSDIVYIGY